MPVRGMVKLLHGVEVALVITSGEVGFVCALLQGIFPLPLFYLCPKMLHFGGTAFCKPEFEKLSNGIKHGGSECDLLILEFNYERVKLYRGIGMDYSPSSEVFDGRSVG